MALRLTVKSLASPPVGVTAGAAPGSPAVPGSSPAAACYLFSPVARAPCSCWTACSEEVFSVLSLHLEQVQSGSPVSRVIWWWQCWLLARAGLRLTSCRATNVTGSYVEKIKGKPKAADSKHLPGLRPAELEPCTRASGGPEGQGHLLLTGQVKGAPSRLCRESRF